MMIGFFLGATLFLGLVTAGFYGLGQLVTDGFNGLIGG